jgi:hypothetical protein
LERFEGKLRVSRVEKKGEVPSIEMQSGRRPREAAPAEQSAAAVAEQRAP